MDGCWMADMVFVVSSWKEEQDMTKVDKACLSKPLDGVSDSGRRARARKHTNRSPTNFSQSNSTVMQWQGSSQRFRKNGVPPSCALRPRASATHSAFSATDCVSCLSPPFGPRSSSSVPFGLFGGSGAICPFEIPRLDVAGSGSSPIPCGTLSPIMATIFSRGHSLGPSFPSPFDPASKQTKRLLSLSSSLHRFENPPNLKLPGFSFSCRMTRNTKF